MRTLKRHIVEYGVPGGVANDNTVQDLHRYLATNPHPDYRLVQSQRDGGMYIIVWEKEEGPKSSRDLLEVCKAAYAKHALNRDDVGWTELTKILGNALMDEMGDEAFTKWVESFDPEQNIET